MNKVYICEACTNEIPYSDDPPEPCNCGADRDSWSVAEKPERKCGGESN